MSTALKKMSYYMLNDDEDLYDIFKKGLLKRERLVGYVQGAMYKYAYRYDKKGQRNSDLDKMVTYAQALRDLEYEDVSNDDTQNVLEDKAPVKEH